MKPMRKPAALALIALLICGLALAPAIDWRLIPRGTGPELIDLEDEETPLSAHPEEDEGGEVIPTEAEEPAETQKPAESEKPEIEKPSEVRPETEAEQPTGTEKPPEVRPETEEEQPTETERPPEMIPEIEEERPEETEEPTEEQEPAETEPPPNGPIEEPEDGEPEVEEPKDSEPEGEQPEDEEPEDEEPEDEEPEDEEPEDEEPTDEEGGEPEPPLSGSIQLGTRTLASASPGGTVTLAIPIRYLCEDEVYRSHADPSGAARAYRDGHSASDYDQSIAELLSQVTVVISAAQGEGFPLEPEALSQRRTLISEGRNMGYAVFEDVALLEEAEPGVYPVRLEVLWTHGDGMDHASELTAYIRVSDEGAVEDGQAEDGEEAVALNESDGDCRLLSVPKTLEFEAATRSNEPQLISLADAMTVEVLDARGTGTWTLTMTAGPLTTEDGGNALLGALVFVWPDGNMEPLPSGGSIVVAEKMHDAEEEITRLCWPLTEGLHIYMEPNEGTPGARYTATITWTLDITDEVVV